jgi:hypothetical protein
MPRTICSRRIKILKETSVCLLYLFKDICMLIGATKTTHGFSKEEFGK